MLFRSVQQDTKYARQSGGKGQYGHVKIRVEPNESGKGYEFVNEVVGGVVPKESPPFCRSPGRTRRIRFPYPEPGSQAEIPYIP